MAWVWLCFFNVVAGWLRLWWCECGCVSSLLVSSRRRNCEHPTITWKGADVLFPAWPESRSPAHGLTLGDLGWVSRLTSGQSFPSQRPHGTQFQSEAIRKVMPFLLRGPSVCGRSGWWADLGGVRVTPAWTTESPTITRLTTELWFMIQGRISFQCGLRTSTFSLPFSSGKRGSDVRGSVFKTSSLDGRAGCDWHGTVEDTAGCACSDLAFWAPSERLFVK